MIDTTQVSGWRHKVLEAARGNTTQLGTILGAVFSYDFDAPPRFSGQAYTTTDGYVMCGYEQSNGKFHNGAFVGSVTDVVKNTVGIAAHCELTGEDRNALFVAVQRWIGHDVYGNSRNDFAGH